jgi:CBS domain-containing protein
MQIRDVMSKIVYSTSPGAALKEAARIMRDHEIGALPVCEAGRLVGILTSRDLVERAAAEGLDPVATPVAAVMTPGVSHVEADQDAHEAAWLMEIKRVRRLPVVAGSEHRLIGIVTLTDLTRHLRDRQLGGEILEHLAARDHRSGDPSSGPAFSRL